MPVRSGPRDLETPQGREAVKGSWLAAQVAIAASWFALVVFGGFHPGGASSEAILRPVVWAVVAAFSHSALGAGLLRAPSHRDVNPNAGIQSGLRILVIRYVVGGGLVLAGLVAFPAHRTVFATSWSGLFLILLVSEMIVFFRGVNRL